MKPNVGRGSTLAPGQLQAACLGRWHYGAGGSAYVGIHWRLGFCSILLIRGVVALAALSIYATVVWIIGHAFFGLRLRSFSFRFGATNLLLATASLLFGLSSRISSDASEEPSEVDLLSPFEESPIVCPLGKLTLAEESGPLEGRAIVYRDSESACRIRLESGPPGSVTFTSPNKAKISVEGTWLPAFCIGAYKRDFNGDGKQDYLVAIGTSACGLPPETVQLVFFLSTTNGYRAAELHSALWSPKHFVDLKGNGTCQCVHTRLIAYAETGLPVRTDKQRETMFNLYQIVGFKGGELEIQSGAPLFPKFVEFLRFGPFPKKHKDSKMLGRKTRDRVVAEAIREIKRSRLRVRMSEN